MGENKIAQIPLPTFLVCIVKCVASCLCKSIWTETQHFPSMSRQSPSRKVSICVVMFVWLSSVILKVCSTLRGLHFLPCMPCGHPGPLHWNAAVCSPCHTQVTGRNSIHWLQILSKALIVGNSVSANASLWQKYIAMSVIHTPCFEMSEGIVSRIVDLY